MTGGIQGFSGSYEPRDVTFLLKPVEIEPIDRAIKERLIQSGRKHYSEIIVQEYAPSSSYLELYVAILAYNAARLRSDILDLAAALDRRAPPGREIVLASFARAGTPIGVLLVRALRDSGRAAMHYSLSIIRDRGLDEQAIKYINARHEAQDVVFIDGWTGKGAIARELRKSSILGSIAPFLVVVADPAGCADLAASTEDYAMPSGLLNGIVSGLVSRTILNPEVVGKGDFHACVRLTHLAGDDVSRDFIGRIEQAPPDQRSREPWRPERRPALAAEARRMVVDVMAQAAIGDINRIKPGIAEATRTFLRRTPQRLYLRDLDSPEVRHLVHLAGESDVPVEPLLGTHAFQAVAVIQPLGRD